MAIVKDKKSRKKNVYLKNNKELPVDVEIAFEPWQIEELRKCREDVVYFAQNYFPIISLDRGKELMQLYEPQKRAVQKIINNRNTIICASRQVGKSSIMTVVCLWYALFNKDYTVGILANKEEMSKEILHRIKTGYRGIPEWLKSSVVDYSKEMLTFSNGSRIMASTTSENSFRGQSINLLFLDEFAFVSPEIAEKFFTSVVPTTSSSETAKMVIVSTPNGNMGKFYEIFTKAQLGPGHKDWNEWAFEKMYWYEIPGRTEEWKRKQLLSINHDMDKWNQEYELHFLSSGQMALNVELIKRLKAACEKPKFSFDSNDYSIWEEPRPDRIISIGVDVSEGIGQDYSISQIVDITDPTDIKHCGIFASNIIKPYEYAEKLNQIARSWGRPFLCIERNGPGGQVIDALLNVHGYDNIVSVSKVDDAAGRYKDQIGIVCHQNNKLAGNTNMRFYLETLESVGIKDIKTLEEFETYVRKTNGRTWGAMKGKNDDRVMALIWALFILEKTVAAKYLNIEEYDETGQVLAISDPNQDIVNYNLSLDGGPRKAAYARSGNTPPPPIFQFAGSVSSYREVDFMDIVPSGNSGFKFI